MRVWRSGMPASVASEIAREGLDLELVERLDGQIDAAHLFKSEREGLELELRELYPLLDPSGFIWVSWPKKTSKVATDITEDAIRDIALPMGLVDVKVCAIDNIWSGLKLVIRKELRP